MKQETIIAILVVVVVVLIVTLGLTTGSGSRSKPVVQDQNSMSRSAEAPPVNAGFVGRWSLVDNSDTLIVNADGTVLMPATGLSNEKNFRWHANGSNRIDFDGWVINKGFGFGYTYGILNGDSLQLCELAGIKGRNATMFRVK